MSTSPSDPLRQASELVHGGPSRLAGRSPLTLARRALRALSLRGTRPIARHAGKIDALIVDVLEAQGREIADLKAGFSTDADRGAAHERRLGHLDSTAFDLISTTETARRRITRVEQRVDRELDELRELPFLAGDPFERFAVQPVGSVLGYRRAQDSQSDGYAYFEDIFRGSADRVLDLQRPYLDLLRGHDPVLDVGCGRGEFLALLAEAGIAGRGVDSDPDMVQRARTLNVGEVILGDANTYLEQLSDRDLGAVFCAQVIEHMPIAELNRFVDLSRRRLRAGGLFVAETVNPHRLASMKNFWVDLTHQHPIFPEVALALCGMAGFASAYVFAPGFDDFEAARYRASSYAVVATTL